MALNFPANPTIDQIYTSDTLRWRWTGSFWKAQGNSIVPYASDTAPPSPTTGAVWFNTSTGQTYIYYSDMYSSQWVELGAPGRTDIVGLTTSDFVEGTNLYYKDSVATKDARIAVTVSGGSYDPTTGVAVIPPPPVVSINGVNVSTTSVTINNSTITEAGNLYYTNARARAAFSVIGGGSYNSSTGVITSALPKITNVQPANSSYVVSGSTVSVAGGYIVITGTSFASGIQVLIGTTLASSVAVYSATEIRAQVPAMAAGTYLVYVVAADGYTTLRVNGVTYV
jgi:hypothetical protein